MRRLAVVAIALAAFTACTPTEIAWWQGHIDRTRTCHGAVDELWPSSSRAWAHRIVDRESGGDAGAQNTRSSAAGCFQLLRIHAWRFDATGSSWAFRYDARANTLAALHLYREQGAAPW